MQAHGVATRGARPGQRGIRRRVAGFGDLPALLDTLSGADRDAIAPLHGVFSPSAAVNVGIAVAMRRGGLVTPAILGVDGPDGVDLLSAIVSGLAHQQVANDPGGDRWVLLARHAVEVLVADVDQRAARPTKKPATTRRVKL